MKIKAQYIDPFENLFYQWSDDVAPTLHGWGVTPNMVTVTATFLVMWALYQLWLGNYGQFAVFYLINVFLDSLDGHMARKYKIFSKWGGWLDHIKDIVAFIVLLYIVWVKIWPKNPNIIIKFGIFLGLFGVLYCIHCSCMTIMHNDPEHEHVYSWTKPFCPRDKIHDRMKILRWFSASMFQVLTVIWVVIMFHCNLK